MPDVFSTLLSGRHRLRSAVIIEIGILMSCSVFLGIAQGEPPSGQDTVALVSSIDSLGVSSLRTFPLERPEWHSMITNLPGDWGRAATRTFSVGALPALAGIGVLTGVLIAADHTTYTSTREFLDRHAAAQSICDVMEHVGDGRVHLGIAATFGIVGFATDDTRALRTASQTVEALLATGIVVQLLKHITGRESPEAATSEGGTWRFFPNLKEYHRHQTRYYAFPSGHIATTMSTVTVIAENYPEVGWIKPVGYTIVGLLGFGLVGVGFHWYSDLPLGIAIGYTFGSIASHRDEPETMTGEGKRSSLFTVLPSVGPDGAGITLAVTF